MSTNTTIYINNVAYGTGYEKVFRLETETTPERDVEVIEIPGRNGSLLIDNKKYHDVEMTYTIVFYPGPAGYQSVVSRVKEFIDFLKRLVGYFRFRDSDFSGEFYEARLSGDLIPTFSPERGMAKMQLTFIRKPQRFLISGEQVFSGSKQSTEVVTTSLSNSGSETTRPLFQIYGAGTFKVNNQTITISSAEEYTMIDSEMMECYKGSVSKNGQVTFSNYEFPVFVPGVNSIEFGTGITQWNITPRWWRL